MVRCADCGFLGLRNVDSGELDEADELFRQSGTLRAVVGKGTICIGPSVCAKGLIQFASDPSKNMAQMNDERECDGFIKRMVGLSPKEHRELEMDKLLRDEMVKQNARSLWFMLFGAAMQSLATIAAVCIAFWLSRASTPPPATALPAPVAAPPTERK